MNRPLTPKELAGIRAACDAVRRIADATPTVLSGPELVHALMSLLMAQSEEGAIGTNLGAVGIAAAAIAALVELERGERVVVA
jgi:hypothetical protein